MSPNKMHEKIEQVLRDFDAQQLEDRIAPVKCEKNPEAPECQVVSFYGAMEYGVDVP